MFQVVKCNTNNIQTFNCKTAVFVNSKQNYTNATIVLFLLILIILTYFPIVICNFFEFDDFFYLNNTVCKGLTTDGILFSLTSHMPYWQPFSHIANMFACHFFGMNPTSHHLINVSIHAINSVLLFTLLFTATRFPWRSGLVATLFAIHPVNVESVVWIAERNLLLSAMFGFLALWMYTNYVHRRDGKYYVFSFLFFAFSLMAKPIFITLPFVMLLLDHWPFDRYIIYQKENMFSIQKTRIAPILYEKLPFFILTGGFLIISSILTKAHFLSTDHIPLTHRISNSIISYIRYVANFFWPFDLSVLYPFPDEISFYKTALCLTFLFSATFFIYLFRLSMPFLIIGWLWFLGVFIPVIGLVQAGIWSAMADRFAYLPYIGIGIMLSYSFPHPKRPRTKYAYFAIVAFVIFLLSLTSNSQIYHWETSKSLFQHALRVTEGNHLAHFFLGMEYKKENSRGLAMQEFEKTIALKPDFFRPYFQMGLIEFENENYEKALRLTKKSLEILPMNPDAYANLGAFLIRMDRPDDAMNYLIKAIQIDPFHTGALNNIGLVFLYIKNNEKAIFFFEKAIALEPENLQFKMNLDLAKKKQE